MNPFEAFEKNASAAGFSSEQIETLKKEALASVNPEQKQKVAAEQSFANYTDGFTKAAAEYGIASGEANDLFKIATTVTVDTLPVAIKTHFGRTKEKTASEKQTVTTVSFVSGFAKHAQSLGLKGEQTAAILEKQGFDLEAIKAYLQNEQNAPMIGAGAGALGGAGLGALAGGEGNRGKGALTGALAGGLGGAGLGMAHQQGGQMKEQAAKGLQDQQGFNLGNFLDTNKRGYEDGMLQQQARDTMGQSNIGAFVRNLTGSKPFATQDTPYSK